MKMMGGPLPWLRSLRYSASSRLAMRSAFLDATFDLFPPTRTHAHTHTHTTPLTFVGPFIIAKNESLKLFLLGRRYEPFPCRVRYRAQASYARRPLALTHFLRRKGKKFYSRMQREKGKLRSWLSSGSLDLCCASAKRHRTNPKAWLEFFFAAAIPRARLGSTSFGLEKKYPD